MISLPVFEKTKCDGCGLCLNVCRGNVLSMKRGTVLMAESGKCDWCGNCEAVCSTGAISCPYDIVG